MARNIPLSTIGVKVSYCVETSVGIRPTSDYIKLSGVYSTPSFNIEPNTVEAGDFDNEEYDTQLPLLKSLPSNLNFGLRFGEQSMTDWDNLIAAYKAGVADGKETWFCIDIPGYSKSMFFTGVPSEMGLPDMEYNDRIDATGYVTPTGEPVKAADPTYKS